MPTFQTGGYQVRSSAVNKIKQAIKEFVEYVRTNEPGTKVYLAWQEKTDPTRFLHLFIFEDEDAQKRRGESEAVKRFEAAYSPELVDGDVVFTDYQMIAGKREDHAQKSRRRCRNSAQEFLRCGEAPGPHNGSQIPRR